VFRPLPLRHERADEKAARTRICAPPWPRHKIAFIALNTIRQSAAERALLVAVDFAGQRRQLTRTAALARDAALASIHAGLQDDPLEAHEPAPPSAASIDLEASLEEFRELVISAGAEIAGEIVQRRPKPDPATLIGSGKVEELAGIAGSSHADVILFDHDLTPTQLRNLDDALPCRLVDRTQLILDIFARHARTREGQLQVELAQLEYMLPRDRTRLIHVAARRRHRDTRTW